MTSRQRFQGALSHRQPDRVPVDFNGHACSRMHVTCIAALRDYYGLPKEPVKVIDVFSMTGEIDEDLKRALGIDVEALRPYGVTFCKASGYVEGWKEWRVHGKYDVLVPAGFNVTDDGRGGYYAYPQGDTSLKPSGHMPKDGFYFDVLVRQEPYDEENPKLEDNLEEYQSVSSEQLAFLKGEAERAAATGRGVTASLIGTGLGDIAHLPGPNLMRPKGIRNIEDWYMSPLLRPEFMVELFERQIDIAIPNLEKLYAAVGENVDAVLVCGTDFGTQRSAFLSAETFHKIYIAHYRRVNDWVHAHTGWKTLKHSCGSIDSLLPAFIEAGFDGINPVQCSAEGMDAEYLKRTYGKDLFFWGGGVDTQHVLPFGTPEEVRAQVLERCEIFAPGGGFIFNAIHCVQCGTPVKNIVAMIDAVKEFNGVK